MGAEVLGGRLLGEVEGVEMGELLSSLRALQNPGPATHFGIPALDALLYPASASPTHPATNPEQPQTGNHGTQFPTHSTATHPKQTQHVSRKPKHPIIELVSTSPGAGKTHLLYLITCIAVLPQTFRGTGLCGKNSAVVIIDTESRFSVQRLAEVMLDYVLRKMDTMALKDDSTMASDTNPPQNLGNIDPILRAALQTLIKSTFQHIHIFHPTSISSLLSTLKTLPTYLFSPVSHPSSPPVHYSLNRPLHSIHIPSIDAFTWSIRSQTPSPSTSPYALLLSHLRNLSTKFQAPVITTSLALSLSPYRSGVSPVWTGGVDVRLGVERKMKQRFREGVCWEDLNGVREEKVDGKRGEFEVWVVSRKNRESREGKEAKFRFGVGGGVWVVDEDVETEGK